MIRVRKREGHYTIKIVDRLPKTGNSNWLYALRGEEGNTVLGILYEWNPFTKEFEEIIIGSGNSQTTLEQGSISRTLFITSDDLDNCQTCDGETLEDKIAQYVTQLNTEKLSTDAELWVEYEEVGGVFTSEFTSEFQ